MARTYVLGALTSSRSAARREALDDLEPGQPGTGGGNGSTSCSNFTTTPGNSASAQSPFNPNGQAGQVYAGNPGTASAQHSNSTHSISEYDIACFQQTVHGH